MIALNHILTGMAIGLTVRQPILAIPLAFVSHFILDVVPHFDYGRPGTKRFWISWTIDAVASGVAIVLLCLSAPELAWLIVAGGLAAELPDVFWVRYLVMSKQSTHWFFVFHKRIQWSETNLGAIPELIYLVFIGSITIALLR